MTLAETIERFFAAPPGAAADVAAARKSLDELMAGLNTGNIRAAECRDGVWRVNGWVKKGILLAFRLGKLAAVDAEPFRFFDKDTMPLKNLRVEDGVRVVPGGSAVRNGAYVARGVVMMPPSYVNVGAWIGEGTMIDSHALVGSCAQVGKNVHVSAAAQIGGVLEPAGALPVIIEDGVFVGGNCGIYEGTIVSRRAVVAAGVVLTGGTPVYDIVRGEVRRRTPEGPLVIPEGAVVVAGNRHIHQPFAKEHHLSVYAPVIIKYRDEKTDAATALEESLR